MPPRRQQQRPPCCCRLPIRAAARLCRQLCPRARGPCRPCCAAGGVSGRWGLHRRQRSCTGAVCRQVGAHRGRQRRICLLPPSEPYSDQWCRAGAVGNCLAATAATPGSLLHNPATSKLPASPLQWRRSCTAAAVRRLPGRAARCRGAAACAQGAASCRRCRAASGCCRAGASGCCYRDSGCSGAPCRLALCHCRRQLRGGAGDWPGR